MSSLYKNMVTIGEAASYLGVTRETLRRWHADGTFPPSFVSPGGHRYYSRSDLEKRTRGLFRVAEEWAGATMSGEPASDFYCASSDQFKSRHERMVRELQGLPSAGDGSSLISSVTGEIGNNSFDHNLGNWPDLPGIFFGYDFGKRIIVLADRGRGVLATLQKVRPDLGTDEQAIRVAFTEFVTGRAPEHRGNGLKYVRAALAAAGAELWFRSGNAILEINRGESEPRIIRSDHAVRGTIACIRF